MKSDQDKSSLEISPPKPSLVKRLAISLIDLRFLIPLTPLGLLVALIATWTAFFFANKEADFVLYGAALVTLLILVITLFATLSATLILRLIVNKRKSEEDLNLQCQVRTATRFSYPRFKLWPFVQVQLQWLKPKRVQASIEKLHGSVQEIIFAEERAEEREIIRRFIVSDIFGLTRLAFKHRVARHIEIMPGPAEISEQIIASHVGGDGISHPAGPTEGELLDMRRYAPGDPMRFVLWKVFARTRQLIVRTPERAIAPSPSLAAYFIAGKGDEAIAALARAYIEKGLLGDDFIFSADGSLDSTRDPEDAIKMIIRSVKFRKNGASGLSQFLGMIEKTEQRSILLFAPSIEGKWLVRLAKIIGRLNRTSIVLAVDSLTLKKRRNLFARLLFVDRDKDQKLRLVREISAVTTRLNQLGLPLRLIHRPSGDLINIASLPKTKRRIK